MIDRQSSTQASSTQTLGRCIGQSEDLQEGGLGLRFVVRFAGAEESRPAFAVRVGNEVRAYLNLCAHVPVEMDLPEQHFLDESGLYVVCATHGAMYDAQTGGCVGGPCRGAGLIPVPVQERDGKIWCIIAE